MKFERHRLVLNLLLLSILNVSNMWYFFHLRVITYLLQREHCSQGTSRLNCSSYSKIINTTAIYPPTYMGCPCHHCYKIEQGNTPLIEYSAGPYMLHPRYTRPWPIIQGGAPQIIFQVANGSSLTQGKHISNFRKGEKCMRAAPYCSITLISMVAHQSSAFDQNIGRSVPLI